MCGFVGVVNITKKEQVDISMLKAMNRTMKHRGPDDEGYYCKNNVGIGHRRLSIIDISASGQQPIYNENKTILVVLNGEIYNFKILKEDLLKVGHIFKTQTDTEVIVHAYEQWGLDFINLLDGMFSLALFDIPQSKLILAKDVFGKKPLYYTLQNGVFLFASELKAFFPYNRFEKRLDLNALSRYLTYEYIPTPFTIFENCQKLPAGSYLEIDINAFKEIPCPVKYWQLQYEPKLKISQEEAIEQLRILLKQSVAKRLISDVPLGVFLSGGIDSSSIVAQMSEIVSGPNIDTFNIGFYEKSYDESTYAAKIAELFNTKHHEKLFNIDKILDFIPNVIEMMDEPFSDPSVFPTYILCQYATKYVTVALGGDGGDELFAGYDTFAVPVSVSKFMEMLPSSFYKSLRQLDRCIPVSDKNMSMNFKIKHFLKGYTAYTKNNLELRNNLWLSSFYPEVLRDLVKADLRMDLSDQNIYCETYYHRNKNKAAAPVDRVIDNFINLYLHDDILTKVDRTSMMNSLEVRAPFLDKNLASFVNRLPVELKINGSQRKYILKKAMQGVLPETILNRPKKGFGIPIAKWIRGSLKPLIQETFSSRNIDQSPFFNGNFIRKLLDEHFQHKRDHRKEIWTLFIFELWRQHHKL